MKKNNLFFILILFSTYLTAQNDSIKIPESISQELNDSLRMELLLNEALNVEGLFFEDREVYLQMAEKIAVQQKYNIRYYFILGRAGDFYDIHNEYDRAISFYKKAIKLKETLGLAIEEEVYAKVYNALSGTIQNKADASTNIDKKELYEEAILHSKMAVKTNPDFNNAWLLLGNANIYLANELINIATKTDIESKHTLYEEALSGFEEAILAYKKVIELRPNHPDIQRNFGVLYRDRGRLLGQYLGRLDLAILSLETSISYSNKDFECFRLLGVATGIKATEFEQEGLKGKSFKTHYKAIRYFKRALDIDPNSLPTLYNIHVAYYHLGKTDKAEEYRAKWKKIDPDYVPSEE